MYERMKYILMFVAPKFFRESQRKRQINFRFRYISTLLSRNFSWNPSGANLVELPTKRRLVR